MRRGPRAAPLFVAMQQLLQLSQRLAVDVREPRPALKLPRRRLHPIAAQAAP